MRKKSQFCRQNVKCPLTPLSSVITARVLYGIKTKHQQISIGISQSEKRNIPGIVPCGPAFAAKE